MVVWELTRPETFMGPRHSRKPGSVGSPIGILGKVSKVYTDLTD